jgi:crotonobetainyl-CoA:carnitine CoA-transferase CaiB-like acyl-CoA transferase
VRNLDEVIHDAELEAKGMVVSVVDEYSRAYRQLGVVLRCKDIHGNIGRPAPELGEHTDEILLHLGMGSKVVKELKTKGVV